MTIEFYDAVDGDGLFNVLGKAFHAQGVANTARGTTVPAEVEDVYEQFNAIAVAAALEGTIANLPSALSSYQSSGSVLLSGLQQFASSFLTEIVNADAPLNPKQLSTALAELIRQMIAAGESVDASTVGLSVAVDADNDGNGIIVLSTKRGDGLVQENLYAETIAAVATSDGLTAPIQFVSPAAAPSLLDHRWPLGSGITTSIPAVSATNSLLTNGDFEDEDDIANAPDDWFIPVGTVGTTIKMTDVEIQTVVIAGTPTSGNFRLLWVNADGENVATPYLPFNASQSQVQAALRTIPGLASVTVVTTGTMPNFTHAVTFTGRGGNVAQLTSQNNFDTGTITHNTTSAGTPQVFAGGKAVEFDSNGSQLTTIQQSVSLDRLTAYAVSLWAIADVVPAAGMITVDLVDGVAGNVLRDAQGVLNSFKFDCTDLLTTWQSLNALVSAVNEVQTLTITGAPDGGDFTLTFDGQTTAPIAYNAVANDVRDALLALSNIGAGDVTCGGGGLPGTPVTITFQGRFAGRAMPLITADGSGLTGGTTPDAAVALTTLGSSGEPVFRTPSVLPDTVYFRIHISTAVSAGTSVFLDHAAMTSMRALYSGGPLAAAFSGSREFKRGDAFTVTATNNRAGLLQEWFARNFGMANLGLLLPSDTSPTIPDSVVS